MLQPGRSVTDEGPSWRPASPSIRSSAEQLRTRRREMPDDPEMAEFVSSRLCERGLAEVNQVKRREANGGVNKGRGIGEAPADASSLS